jgi:hypothetical protein
MRTIRGVADAPHAAEVEHIVLKAYRWTYFVSGMLEPRFVKLLESMTTEAQRACIDAAMAPLLYAMPAEGAPVPAMAA